MAHRCRRSGLDTRRCFAARCLGSGLAAIALLCLSASGALASDCPPGGYTDCAYATTLAINPLVPIGGAGFGIVVAIRITFTVGLTIGGPVFDRRAGRASRPLPSDARSGPSETRRVDVGPSWLIDTFTMPLVRVVENPLGRENRAAHPNLAGASSVVATLILALPIGLTALWGEGEIEARHALHVLFGLGTERGEP